MWAGRKEKPSRAGPGKKDSAVERTRSPAEIMGLCDTAD
jgi:hypothetical protein